MCSHLQSGHDNTMGFDHVLFGTIFPFNIIFVCVHRRSKLQDAISNTCHECNMWFTSIMTCPLKNFKLLLFHLRFMKVHYKT
jgi:hypothetical protein